MRSDFPTFHQTSIHNVLDVNHIRCAGRNAYSRLTNSGLWLGASRTGSGQDRGGHLRRQASNLSSNLDPTDSFVKDKTT